MYNTQNNIKNEVNILDTKEKEKRLKKTLEMMTETELKEMCFDSFIDGIEKGMKIQNLKNKNKEEKATETA